MPTGLHCQSPAIKDTLFCYHHTRHRKLTARPKRYGSITIPYVFPEDRDAVQTNIQLTVLAILEGRIEPQVGNAIINAYRACAANLKAGPLAHIEQSEYKNTVQTVILTPDEQEVSRPRQILEPGETLAHGPECPCAVCAEQYRNAPPEEHHPNCKCGHCSPTAPPPPQPPPVDAALARLEKLEAAIPEQDQ